MGKILLVAPVPTHPSTTGASARVRHMGDGLLSLGHEVHFLHLQQQLWNADTAMERYWKDRLHVFRALSLASCISRARRKLLRVTAKTLHLNLAVDSYFDPEAAAFTRTLLTEGRFEVAILSYVFYSRLLESMPGTVRKLIDTHDVFSDRFRIYRAHGLANEFFSTGRSDEGKALDRADAVLAIQEWDANHFRSLTDRPVVVVGHLGRPEAMVSVEAAVAAPAMLFVGGPMGINVHGVTWFIDRVLPAVRRLVPNVELWLVGGIGERVGHGMPGVRRLGFVDALGDLYRRAAVVINPQQFGTGLSIKSVDALLHGRPLVTTASGARGLEDGAGSAFRRAESPEDFSAILVDLLRDPAQAAAVGMRATEFARDYHRRNLEALGDVVSAPRAR